MNRNLGKSAIYEGIVSHCRLFPVLHSFRYKVFMMFIDLSEAEQLFRGSWFWSFGKFNLACFLRKDYLGKHDESLDKAVRDKVEEQSGQRPSGRICVLTNFRYFAYLVNPITCYYCYDEADNLQYLLAEVTNTPWGQRHAYVIPCTDKKDYVVANFSKQHHVSPFMPMQMRYSWRSNLPDQHLKILIDTYRKDQKHFFASLMLTRKEISPATLRRILLAYPAMTLKVGLAIYWQALHLWLKRIPFYPNPNSTKQTIKHDKSSENALIKKVKGVQP
tara:strand:- start:153455 stop:154279 length:825 start_codon:yes stop_codon:yes gene_type:complete